MRISLRLTAGFLAIAAMVGVVGYLSSRTDQQIERQLERLARSTAIKTSTSTDMVMALGRVQVAAHELIIEKWRARAARGESQAAAPQVQQQLDAIETNRKLFQHSLGQSRAASQSLIDWAEQEGITSLAEEEQRGTGALLDRLAEQSAEHFKLLDEFLRLADRNPDAADAFLTERLQTDFRDNLLPLISTHRSDGAEEVTKGVRSVQRAIARQRDRSALVTVITLLVAVVLGLLIARSVARPLAILKNAAMDVGKGRWEFPIPVHSSDEIGVLATAFNDMLKELQEKTVSKAYVDNIIQSMEEILVVTDPQGRICRVNQAAQRQLGFTHAELLGQSLADLCVFSKDAASGESTDEYFSGRERTLRSKSGESIPVYCSASELRDEAGGLQGTVFVGLNIAERLAAEQRLRASLAEKEVLLKEIHHRVKNNLQVISSLLNLQAQATCDPEAVRLLRESQSRIRSMALIHEQLYQSGNLARIDFSDYVCRLTSHLMRSFDTAGRSVAIQSDVEQVWLPLKIAIPCGMIINELVTNAMQHGFPDGRSGDVRVHFHRDDEHFTLAVEDNGQGAAAGIGPPDSATLGMKVVQALVRQLRGHLAVEHQAGTKATICFAEPTADELP